MEDIDSIRDRDRQTTAALLLAITHMPFGLSGLATLLAAKAEIGPLTAGFEDVLLDNLGVTHKQAKAIASVYRRIPHVARAIAAEEALANTEKGEARLPATGTASPGRSAP